MDYLLDFTGKWLLEPKIGFPEDAMYQTVKCPQEGGEFVGMSETARSPVGGIQSWRDCANLCSSQSDCLHWQWRKNEKVCNSVTSFTGFQANAAIISGARNCPISSQTLFNLCPTGGSNSHMLRKVTSENNKFYDPNMKLGKV